MKTTTTCLCQTGAACRPRLQTLVLILLLAFLPVILVAGGPLAAAASDGNAECFDCHDDEGLEKELGSGILLPLHVGQDPYAASVHADLDCTDCHDGISTDDHPEEGDIASLGEYSRQQSAVCGDCHEDGREGEHAAHRYMTASDSSPACSECHRPHTASPVAAWKAELDENDYCLTCHLRTFDLTMGDGSRHPLTIDPEDLGTSVHSSHDCSECHGDFGLDSHPSRKFASSRSHSVALAETCGDCHDDVARGYADSIHHTLVGDGDPTAPVCTDCHGFHRIQPAEKMAQLTGLPCRRCHEEIFEAFAASRHGSGETRGHFTTPLCADCHRTHEIGPAMWSDGVRTACLSCHDTAESEHREWLPNAGLHLEAVACPACHAPAAERGVDLVLGNGTPSHAFSSKEIAFLLGSVDRNEEEIDGLGLWNLLRRVKRLDGGGQASLEGRIMIRTGIEAHRLAGREGALRDCDSCHNPSAALFDSLSVTIMTEDGRPLRLKADSEVLGSITSVDSLRGFYMLAGTRIKILDLLLVLAVLGGMSVPALHMSARLLAAKPKEEKGT